MFVFCIPRKPFAKLWLPGSLPPGMPIRGHSFSGSQVWKSVCFCPWGGRGWRQGKPVSPQLIFSLQRLVESPSMKAVPFTQDTGKGQQSKSALEEMGGSFVGGRGWGRPLKACHWWIYQRHLPVGLQWNVKPNRFQVKDRHAGCQNLEAGFLNFCLSLGFQSWFWSQG